MSGGHLIMLDRLGRELSRCALVEGLFTLGADPACDIRVLGISSHHANVVVHSNQTVVRNVSEEGSTLVNGRCVSVAALRHCDVITLGDRAIRWEYSDPTNVRRQLAPDPGAHIHVCRREGRGGRGAGGTGAGGARRSEGARGAPRDRALQLALELRHRASMPGNAGGKQVAIVQPQRRDTNEQNDKSSPRPTQSSKRQRTSNTTSDLDTSATESELSADKSKRKSAVKLSTRGTSSPNLQNTTKATLWIESRKTSPRKSAKPSPSTSSAGAVARVSLAAGRASVPATRASQVASRTPLAAGRLSQAAGRLSLAAGRVGTPLRLTVLRKAQSAVKHKQRVTKIQAPLKIDHTKQVAIMLMTGHTPKSKQASPKSAKNTPSFVIKKASPVRKSSGRKSSGRKSAGRQSAGRRSKENASPADIEVTPRRSSSFSTGDTSRRSRRYTQNQSVLTIADTSTSNTTVRESNISTRSGPNSPIKSPLQPNAKKSSLKDPTNKKNTRKTESIKFDLSNLEGQTEESTDVVMLTDTQHSAESSASEDVHLHFSDTSSTKSPSPRRSIHSRSRSSLGTSPVVRLTRTLTPESPRARKSLRSSTVAKNVSEMSDPNNKPRRTTKDRSKSMGSAFKTRTLSPRSPNDNMESYSIVDLVSIDSNDTRSSSVYNSVRSTNSSAFGTPANSNGRTTRSTIDPTLLGSSTPYVHTRSSLRSQSNPNVSKNSTKNSSSRRSKSLTTPENSRKHISVNSTRISRASRSRSRINDSDLLLISGDENEGEFSPKTSKRISSRAAKSQLGLRSANSSVNETSSKSPKNGTITPENRHSPEEPSTPVLSIKSLLDASINSSLRLTRKGTKSLNLSKVSHTKKSRSGALSKSLNITARKTRLRLSKESSESCKTDEGAPQPDNEETVTPKSAVKLIPEAVKNKHSTAKKPQSKRSIIDDLNESDIVKQLFNSPVKRKLSQSMTEFSRKLLFDDDDVPLKRPTRSTVTGVTPEDSLVDHTDAYTPEIFVSPLNTPRTSPNLFGIKRLFKKNTPENDLRNVRGVRALLRTPRRSPENDLTNVSGIKLMFAKSPKNRLSDVRVKELFAAGPRNDLRRVTGVKSVYQTRRNSPKNNLDDVGGVKRMFTRNSPKNDLSDVRGLRRMFREEKRKSDYDNVSGIEELFNESNTSQKDSESLFNQLIGRPPIKAVYSKTFTKKVVHKPKTRNAKSLHNSIDMITNNVEEWLEQELQKRLHKGDASTSKHNKSKNTSKSYATRELQKLTTDLVDGSVLRNSRARNSTLGKTILSGDTSSKKSASEVYSAHMLPIKKRSLVEVDKSKNESRKYLPIKKRVVVHSTPMKGRKNLTMNASELGRVSPIAAVDNTANVEHNTSIGSTEATDLLEPAPKNRRQTKAKIEAEKTKASPKITRASKAVSLTKGRATRNRKTSVESNSIIKKRASIVITKKSPVKNPTLVKAAQEKADVATPEKKLSRTRRQKNDVKTTPKITRAKVVKSSVVVSKPSPILKPQGARTRQKIEADKPKTTRGKKTEVTESPKESPIKTKGKRKAAIPETEPREVRGRKPVIEKEGTEKPVQEKRGRKAKVVQDNTTQVNERSVRTRGKKIEPQVNVQSEPTKGKSRGKKVVQESVESEPKPTRTRGKKLEEPKANITEVKTRGKKVKAQESVQSEPPTRGRKAKIDNDTPEVNARTKKTEGTETVELKGRKRKTVTEEVIVTKLTRASKKAIETTESTNRRQKRSVVKDKEISEQNIDVKAKKPTRAKKVVTVEAPAAEAKPTRGRKTAAAEETKAKAPVSRKRKYNAEPSPTKEPAKKQPAARSTRKTAGGGATTREKTSEPKVETKTAGRPRRR